MLISINTQNCMIDAAADFFPSQTIFLTIVKIYKFERTSERSVMMNNKHIFVQYKSHHDVFEFIDENACCFILKWFYTPEVNLQPISECDNQVNKEFKVK